MSAQQKYLYQYAYLDGSSFNAVENNNLYNDERGRAEILQNYNHNSLNLNFKAGEHTAKALSVLLASGEVGLILKAISHTDIVSQYLDVYDLVKIGNINLNPNFHFYEVGGEFLSNQINNVDFLTRRIILPHVGDIPIDDALSTKINDGTNDYFVNAEVLTNGMASFYYPTGDDEGAPVALIDLRDLDEITITFSSNFIPANFLSGFVNPNCHLEIRNAGSIMKIGNNVFANSEFSNIKANFTGIREIGSNVKLAKTGGVKTTENPLGLVAYDDLKIQMRSEVDKIDGLIFKANTLQQKIYTEKPAIIINDNCNLIGNFAGSISEIKNSKIKIDIGTISNLFRNNLVVENCEFEVSQEFPANLNLTIKNSNHNVNDDDVITFDFSSVNKEIILENSFHNKNAIYTVPQSVIKNIEVDNYSFLNAAGIENIDLAKFMNNNNRDLPALPPQDASGFLKINEYLVSSFTNNYLRTPENELIELTEITLLEFSSLKKWNLENGNFENARFVRELGLTIRLYEIADGRTNILKMINNSFNNFIITGTQDLYFYLSSSQIVDILNNKNCFNTVSNLINIYMYNDLPDDFNFMQLQRNLTSFNLNETSVIQFMNNGSAISNYQFAQALMREYPEYVYRNIPTI